MKKLALLLSLLLTAAAVLPAAASDPYRAYTYSTTDEGALDVAAPQAYLPEKVYTGRDLGIDLKSPEDIQFDASGNLYICDTGSNAVYVLDPELKPVRTVRSFRNGETEETFSAPYGIFVTAEGKLYVADAGNSRVVVLEPDGSLCRIIGAPRSELLSEDFAFVPQKVLADTAGRVFVLSKNINEGIMQFTEEGSFLGFYGSNTVVASGLTLMWKRIMTEEQTEQLTQFVPVEYKNFSLDDKGFIYAVTAVTEVGNPVRRLNLSGGDVLVRDPIDGTEKVVGDVNFPYAGVTGITGPSSFVDITSDTLDNYYVLDDKRGRVFAYDDRGNLLFVFGTLNAAQVGAFASPSAIEYRDGRVYAADRASGELIVFAPTGYTELMLSAMEDYLNQKYEDSLAKWEEVIKCNNNCDLAYFKAGYCLYWLKQYDRAMAYFKLVNAKEAYSEASDRYSQLWLNDNFEKCVAGGAAVIAALAVLWIAVRRLRRRAR